MQNVKNTQPRFNAKSRQGARRALLAEEMSALMAQTSVCTATFAQLAAVEAFTATSNRAVERMAAEFRRRRDFAVAWLNEIEGVSCDNPPGAVYTFPDMRATGRDERQLVERLLTDAHVAVLPGTSFGEAGKGHLRISLATSMTDIELGIERIERFLARERPGAYAGRGSGKNR